MGFVDDESGLTTDAAGYEAVSISSNYFLLFFIRIFEPKDCEGELKCCEGMIDPDSFILTCSMSCSLICIKNQLT